MKTFLNIFLMLLAMLVPFSSLADKIEKSKVVISNDIVVVANLYVNGYVNILKSSMAGALKISDGGGGSTLMCSQNWVSWAQLTALAKLTVFGGASLNTLRFISGAAVGSTWVVTNVSGAGTLEPLCAFRGKLASNLYLTNAIVYDFVCSEEYDYGNNYDGTTFVAPVNGLYEFRFEGFLRPAGASLLINYLRVIFTGSALLHKPYVYGASRKDDRASPFTFWSGTLTNNQIVKVTVNGVAGYTNYLEKNYCFFEGKLIRALP